MSTMRRFLAGCALFALSTALVANPAEANPKATAVIQKRDIEAIFDFRQVNQGVHVNIDVRGGLFSQEVYKYHVHERPVPLNGSCDATGGHYDPDHRMGANCTRTTLTACEVGDLSAKWGAIVPDHDSHVAPINYTDPTLSLTGDRSIMNRSIVIHNATGERIACASILEVTGGSDNAPPQGRPRCQRPRSGY